VLAPRASADDRELGAAEVVRSLPTSTPNRAPGDSRMLTPRSLTDELPQREQNRQQQQQRASTDARP
jgi:hypothetical protein